MTMYKLIECDSLHAAGSTLRKLFKNAHKMGSAEAKDKAIRGYTGVTV